MKPKGSVIKRYECKDTHPKGQHKKSCKVTSYWARVIFTDPETGKVRDLSRRAETKTAASDLKDALIADIKKTAGRSVGSEHMTFGELCDYFERHYVKPAEYVGDRKVAGMRSLSSAKAQLAALRAHFGNHRLRSLTYGKLRDFRSLRLKEKTRAGTQRSIAAVNRDLALCRRMLNVAMAEGWIPANPFKQGESLVTIADEKKRERILTRDEEKTLLAACETPNRAHLRAIIIAALDTGCRLGELLKLRWRDVDLDAGEIHLVAFNTKTARERWVALTTRLRGELERLKDEAPDEPSFRVFGITSNVKRSFTGARKDAGLENVRFHDLRHTAATRLVQHHIPLSEVGRVLGHSQANTTYRYVNPDAESRRRAASVLDSFNEAETTATELVN